jgi:hypothetical protein
VWSETREGGDSGGRKSEHVRNAREKIERETEEEEWRKWETIASLLGKRIRRTTNNEEEEQQAGRFWWSRESEHDEWKTKGIEEEN